MAYNDYVILVDENGQPFIAHAFGDRIKNYVQRRKDHKYIQRFDNYFGPGKHAYAYSDAEVKLYSAGRKVGHAAKRAAKFVDDHDAGLSERVQSRYYQSKANAAKRRGDKDASNEYAMRSASYRRQSKDEYGRSGVKKAVDAADRAGRKAARYIDAAGRAGRKVARYIDDHDAGITERIQAKVLEGVADRVGKKNRDAGLELAAEAARLRRQGKSEYESSNAKKVIDTVTKYGSTSLSAVKGAGSKAGSTVSGAASKAGGSVKSTITNAQSTISNVIDRKITGKTAQANLTQAQQNAALGLDGAMGEVADAQQALSEAIVGGNANKIKAARETLSEVVSSAKSFLAKTGNLFTKSEKATIESALNYELDPVTGEWVLKR